MFINGIDVNMEEGDRHYLKILGIRMEGNPFPGKVSLVAVCRRQMEHGPLGVSYAWNDGTGDVNKSWDEIPQHLKLVRNGEDFFGF